MKNETVPVAKEGIPFILLFAFITLISAILEFTLPALTGLLATVFSVYFFRDPSRVMPETENGIICPADGKVIVVKEVEDERFHSERMQKVSIFMNVFNVHVNRVPLAGTVERVLFKPGAFYAADKDKAVLHNEYCAITVATPDDQRYTVVQIAGLIARRIVCRAVKGDALEAGSRYGLIRFGSRVDLYLPMDADIMVREGDKVRSGETLLGTLTSTAD